jgi:Caspase domain
MADRIRVALVVGNSAYTSAPTLINPVNDARDIASAFTRIGFSGISLDDAPGGSPTVVPMLDLDHRQLRDAIVSFARAADGAEQALMYYAGHGIEIGGQNYLVPVDANLQKISDVGLRTVSLNELLEALAHSSGLKFIILDACRENPFRNLIAKARGLSRGLSRVEPSSRDILVAYAAKHGTVALDGNGSPNSPFATAFLEHVEEPGLEIRNLLGEVRDSVLEITENQQEPFLYGTLGRKQEYLVPAARGESDAKARALWLETKASNDPMDYEGFLVEFPESPFALLAERNSERLMRVTNDVDVLNRFKAKYASSPRNSLVDRRIADISAQCFSSTPATEHAGAFKKHSPWYQRVTVHLPISEVVIGSVSAILSRVTFAIPLLSFEFVNRFGFSANGYEQFHTGIIFGLALLVCMHRLGFRKKPELVGLVISTLVLWIFYANAAVVVVTVNMLNAFGPNGMNWSIFLTSAFLVGLAVAALLSISTQWLCDRIVNLRAVIITALLGGVANLTLPLDLTLWLPFLIWWPTVLTSLSLTMRHRIAKLLSSERTYSRL